MLSLLDFAVEATPNHVSARNRTAAPEILHEDHSAAASEGCASLDTTGGRVSLMTAGATARKARWHRFGVDVKEATDRYSAAELARLNWTVSKRPTFYRDRNGEMRESLTTWAIVRDDTDEQLHTVGTDYEPIQTVDQFDFLDSLMGEFGARYETAGALRGGRQVFMQIQLPQSWEVVRGDGVQTCVTFTNSHAGAKAYIYPTTQRIVCANTFAIAQKDKDHGLGMKHTGNVRGKIQDARNALAKSIKGFETFKEQAEAMVRTPITTRGAIDIFDGILDSVCEVTKADMIKGADALAAAVATTQAELEFKAKQIKRQIGKRRDMMADLQTRLNSDTNRVPGMQGTAWAVFNAATEQANHGAFGRQVGTDGERAARRFDSVMNGEAAEMNDKALELCLMATNAR